MSGNGHFCSKALEQLEVSSLTKSVPSGLVLPLGEIARKGWNVLAGDVPLPAAVLRSDALLGNSRWMSDYVASRGIKLAPHVKTTMAPQLIEQQIADGAWALTVATWQQAQVCLAYGARRLILANQLIGRSELDSLVETLNRLDDLELYFLIDSEAGLELFEEAARRGGLSRPAAVLAELGIQGGRTGQRDHEGALRLMARIAASADAQLVGVEMFEGLLQSRTDPAAASEVCGLLNSLRLLLCKAKEAGLFARERPMLTAGGSSFFPQVVDAFAGADAEVVLRSGCYLIHDDGLYERWYNHNRPAGHAEGLQPALEVWTYVQSVPEPQLAILTAGKRDLGHDAGQPIPLKHVRRGTRQVSPLVGWCVRALSDHHAHVTLPHGANVSPGDLVALGVSHPCTTLDKWPLLYLVDETYRISAGVRSFF